MAAACTFSILNSLLMAHSALQLTQRDVQILVLMSIGCASCVQNTITEIQAEMRTAQFRATRAAEQQSAELKRLIDQSKVDASKTQDMLAQV